MVMIGSLGEYLWRNLDETRRRPRYVIESITYKDPEDGHNGGDSRRINGQQQE